MADNLPKWHERRPGWRTILERLYPPAVPGEEALPPAPIPEDRITQWQGTYWASAPVPDPLSDALARLEKAEAALDASLKEMAVKLMLLQTLLQTLLNVEPKP